MRKTLTAMVLGLAGLGLAGTASATPWQTISDLEPVLGADGRIHEASCSGYPGTDPSFRFWVRPGDPKKLAVVFDGGGACWDDFTCSFPNKSGAPRDPLIEFYTPALPEGEDPSRYGGLLNLAHPDNPLRDWTLVAIPYCTADVHMGSNDRSYTMKGHPRGPQAFTIRHRGQDNFMVVLDWISRNMPQDVGELFVTGASAGGYGAAAHFPWLARQYPQARLSVLADASQGVATPAFDASTPGRGSWNPQLAPWVFGADPMAVPSSELLRRGAQAYPGGRFAQYTTTQDGVQVGFYGYMRAAFGPGVGECRRVTPDWNRLMLGTLAQDRALLPNFRSYVLPGSSHTVIGDDDTYAVPPFPAPTVAAWIGAMLAPGAQPGWTDVACPDCLTPMPCR